MRISLAWPLLQGLGAVGLWLGVQVYGPTVALAVPNALDSAPFAGDPALEPLHRQIARLAERLGGRVGAAIVHVESGRAIALKGAERFSMASVYKLPIAIAILDMVDRGELDLTRKLTVKASDLRPGSPLAERRDAVGSVLSVRELIELVMIYSDNSASDLLFDLAGGGEAITKRLQTLKIAGLRVDRPELELLADGGGVRQLPAASDLTLERFERLLAAVPPAAREEAERQYRLDPRDTSTPEAIGRLLVRLQRGDILKPESNRLLLGIMERCATGVQRIPGNLPAGTIVAHKTGTNAGGNNDAGIITLPGKAGHLAVAVFVQTPGQPSAERERLIAEIARAGFDFFVGQGAAVR
ncbi:class A beta-lactamase [Gloeobacter violaceus]|uniref:Gll0595 protein n=1 Tax=Gloeobacter violaceus (strain ATCC 29082 / PCC 7421) TaxID=251221 RepID=Q7NN19_GLOVI|nr:class A beta-lactamase [Gloeobacter violaceus]BAC88536.1 gll0595 [Gloeobacter violaceus PCC 7421]